MTKNANTVASRKNKGRRLQQKIRDDLISALDIDPLDIQSRGMGQPGIDIYLSSSVRDRFPYAIEAKNQESLSIWAALEQAENNAAYEGLTPLVVFKRNRSEIYCALRWSDFLALIQN